jgi:hypothetical protein
MPLNLRGGLCGRRLILGPTHPRNIIVRHADIPEMPITTYAHYHGHVAPLLGIHYQAGWRKGCHIFADKVWLNGGQTCRNCSQQRVSLDGRGEQ